MTGVSLQVAKSGNIQQNHSFDLKTFKQITETARKTEHN